MLLSNQEPNTWGDQNSKAIIHNGRPNMDFIGWKYYWSHVSLRNCQLMIDVFGIIYSITFLIALPLVRQVSVPIELLSHNQTLRLISLFYIDEDYPTC